MKILHDSRRGREDLRSERERQRDLTE